MEKKRCALLFSGGLDSSFTVCKLAETNYTVDLLHFDNGALISNDLALIRQKELEIAYPNCINGLYHYRVAGLFRRIALVSLENDIKQLKTNLICVGCKLAMHVQAIIYCKRNGIKYLADGCTKRQERYGEQRNISIEFIKEIYKCYDIEYINPIYNLSEKDIKYGLFERGMTIQPLEDTCLFSNTFSIAEDEVLEKYLNSKKELVKEIIERNLNYEDDR